MSDARCNCATFGNAKLCPCHTQLLAELARLRSVVAGIEKLAERATVERDDMRRAETYYAEINDGAGLIRAQNLAYTWDLIARDLNQALSLRSVLSDTTEGDAQ